MSCLEAQHPWYLQGWVEVSPTGPACTKTQRTEAEVGPGARVWIYFGRSETDWTLAATSRKHQMCPATDEHVLMLGMAVYMWLWWVCQWSVHMRKGSSINQGDFQIRKRRSLEASQKPSWPIWKAKRGQSKQASVDTRREQAKK